MSTKKQKSWWAVAHTRIGDQWCFAYAVWIHRPTPRDWEPALVTGMVAQLDARNQVVADAYEQACAVAAGHVTGAKAVRLEDGFALAAHRDAAGEEPRYRPVAAPGLAAEAYYAVIEVDRTKALPKTAVAVVQVDEKGNQLAVLSTKDPLTKRGKPTGRSVFWAAWTSCGRPTLEPWTPPDDLGIVEGPGSFEQAIGAADEACRRLRGGAVFAYSVGERFAARAYTDGARCTSSKLVDLVSGGLAALAWMGLTKAATDSEVRRAWGQKVKTDKLHPDSFTDPDEKAAATEAFKIVEARKRAALDYLGLMARSTGEVTAFTAEKIEKQQARKQKAAEKKAKARAAAGEASLL